MRLFRIVRSDPPGQEDFKSDRERGRPPPVDPRMVPLQDGFSAFDTEDRARSKALTFPALGAFIAELEIPESGRIRFERTTKARGHHTVWGRPGDIAPCVVAVTKV